jgi:hypothetical protein
LQRNNEQTSERGGKIYMEHQSRLNLKHAAISKRQL